MYNKCKKEQIPFHHWYEWIRKEYVHHDKVYNNRWHTSEDESSSDEFENIEETV